MQSTAAMEAAREAVRQLLHASSISEIVFTSGTTDAINMLAYALERNGCIKAGDTIAATVMEHHSNLLPWQELCKRTNATLKIVPILPDTGELDMDALTRIVDLHPRLLAITAVSNLTGVANPLPELIRRAHAAGTLVLVDAAQSIRHSATDVQALDCDFLCFSGHKMLALTGIGVLYGKRQHLETMMPAKYGGGMVETVCETTASYIKSPLCFEAGTPNYVGAISLGAAIGYMRKISLAKISYLEQKLLNAAVEAIKSAPHTQILANPSQRVGAVSFTVDGAHAYDVAKMLDAQCVAVRSGHHCAMPYLNALGADRAIRVSPAFYNTREDIEIFYTALCKTIDLLRGAK